jgi:N-hydroxyarylamine O-acetyltransferase
MVDVLSVRGCWHPGLVNVDGYLARLGLDGRPAPTLATLIDLHRRHLRALPYENLAAMLGRPDPVDPVATLDRIAAGGNAGYCFHHNGAFAAVLRELGYHVRHLRGHVWSTPAQRAVPELNHLVLVVSGLPDPASPDGRWWPDLGLGDGFRDPLPLTAGPHRSAWFRYAIEDLDDAGWTFRHDARGSFTAIDIEDRAPSPDEMAAAHAALSRPPGRFTRTLVVQQVTTAGITTVRGRTLTHDRPTGPASTRLESYSAWRGALASLNVALDGVSDADLRSLHDRQA